MREISKNAATRKVKTPRQKALKASQNVKSIRSQNLEFLRTASLKEIDRALSAWGL